MTKVYIEIKEWESMMLPERKSKTLLFMVTNKHYGYRLGIIKWNTGWRQYAFYPEDGTTWSADCLDKITYFVEEKNIEHKKGWKK